MFVVSFMHDGESRAGENESAQVNIYKCVAALEFLTYDFDKACGLLKISKTAEVANEKELSTSEHISITWISETKYGHLGEDGALR